MPEPTAARTGRRARRAFTLVELLVVMAIIALLASLLAPALGAARARAREAVCRSNLHQVGLAVQSYMVDWDGKRPFGFANLADNWLTDPRVLVCAADPLADAGGRGDGLWSQYHDEARWTPWPASYHYLKVPTERGWQYLQRHSKMGYVVCVVHGKAINRGSFGSPPVYQGRMFRLRPDTSVVAVDCRWAPLLSLNTWRRFTDEDHFDPERMANR